MDSSPLRRPAAVLVLFALAACGPAGRAGGTPSESSSGPAAAPAASSGQKTHAETPSEKPSPDRTRPAAADDDGGTSAPAPSGMCRSRDLGIDTEPGEGSGMGHAITRLVFQNTSGRACWLRGYPGVSYVAGDDGHQVGGAARRDRTRPPSAARVWLIPNAHAYALIDQSNPHNYPSGRCHPTSVRGLRVYPPEETASLYVPDGGEACADDATGRPLVSAISKSANPPPG